MQAQNLAWIFSKPTSQPVSSDKLLMRSNGVLPTISTTPSAIDFCRAFLLFRGSHSKYQVTPYKNSALDSRLFWALRHELINSCTFVPPTQQSLPLKEGRLCLEPRTSPVHTSPRRKIDKIRVMVSFLIPTDTQPPYAAFELIFRKAILRATESHFHVFNFGDSRDACTPVS